MTSSEPAVYYSADVEGLWPGAMTTSTTSPYEGQRYTWATSNLDLARALALGGLSIYRVELDPPVFQDPDFKQAIDTWFVMSRHGTILEVVEDRPRTTLEQAERVTSKYALWAKDGSPIYDDDGSATVPPGLREVCTAEDLRPLGQYPAPWLVTGLANYLAAQRYRDE
jgi:hypothetical protein